MSEGALLLSLLNKFSSNYVNLIEGTAFNENENKSNELFGGSRINHIFTQKYTPYLIKLDACENLSEEDIKLAIRNSKGPKSSLFIPEAAFEMLVKSQVKMLLSPSIQCVDQVYDELVTILDFAEKDLLRFPALKDSVREFVIGLFKDYVKPLKKFISDLIDIELSYINTNHPDFFNGGNTSQLFFGKYGKEEKKESIKDIKQQDTKDTKDTKQVVKQVETKTLVVEKTNKTTPRRPPPPNQQKKSGGLFGFFGKNEDEIQKSESKDEISNNDTQEEDEDTKSEEKTEVKESYFNICPNKSNCNLLMSYMLQKIHKLFQDIVSLTYCTCNENFQKCIHIDMCNLLLCCTLFWRNILRSLD